MAQPDREKNQTTESWTRFLDDVREARETVGATDTVWYRGHANPDYSLIPGLFRVEAGLAKEQALFNDYERSAARLMAKRTSDWELLFDMQHYGLPTRLLDWTEVLGIAIAFAMYDSTSDCQDSKIFVLNPLRLNEQSGITGIKHVPSDQNFRYKEIYWHNQPMAAIHPIAIDPPLQSERMFAQNATFTVHGSQPSPVDAQCATSVSSVLLRAVAKPAAREFLEHANLNAYAIYPDIVGMARHLRRKHFPN